MSDHLVYPLRSDAASGVLNQAVLGVIDAVTVDLPGVGFFIDEITRVHINDPWVDGLYLLQETEQGLMSPGTYRGLLFSVHEGILYPGIPEFEVTTKVPRLTTWPPK